MSCIIIQILLIPMMALKEAFWGVLSKNNFLFTPHN